MALIISLDFDLMWGVPDKRSISDYGRNILGVREAIPAVLKLFAKYELKATWATVGMLLARNRREILDLVPTRRPTYKDSHLSPYENGYLGQVGNNEKADPYHFGRSLAEQILTTPGMELGSHTFSHYYCLEARQSAQQFKADVDAAITVSRTLGVTLRSIVFPRNQVNFSYLPVCEAFGLGTFRGSETSWLRPRREDERSVVVRLLRAEGTYLDLSGSHAFEAQTNAPSGCINVPAPSFFRPYAKRLRALEPVRLARIQGGMTQAAKTGRHYHLW